jgi:molybdenum cofactor cytidylyltransferase
MAIVGLLLCGGEARRFGAHKLIAGDDPLAARAARNLLAATPRVLAVLRPGDAPLRGLLEPLGVEILESDRTSRGLGASLAAAVEATARAQGWIVALGDMPIVRSDTIESIRRALEGGASLAAPFDRAGRRGHPVGFSASLRDELLALDGDSGARAIVEKHGARMERIATQDAGIFVDVDTPQDLARLLPKPPSAE